MNVLQKSVCLMVVSVLISSLVTLPLDADAAKGKDKKGGGGDAELQKGLEPVTKTLDDLTAKIQAHALLSGKDSSDLVNLKYTLWDLMTANATNPLMAKPVYQAAELYKEREDYIEAYNLLTFLVTNFATAPYGMRAQGEIAQLKKQLGEAYFAADSAAPAAADASKTPAAADKKKG